MSTSAPHPSLTIEIPRRPPRSRYLWFGGVAALTATVWGFWFAGPPRLTESTLAWAAVAPASVPLELWVDGRVTARRVQSVHSSTGGAVREFTVKVGDRLHRGALIAVIDNPTLQLRAKELAQARDALRAEAQSRTAEAELRMLELEAEQTRLRLRIELEGSRLAAYERLRDLNSVASIELDAARMTLAASRAELEASLERTKRTARIDVQQAELYALRLHAHQASIDDLTRQLAELRIVAPVSGHVQGMAESLSVGSVIDPGSVLVTLVPDGEWVVAIQVGAAVAGQLHVGSEAEISTSAGSIKATVERVEGLVRAEQVEVLLVAVEPLELLLGTHVRARLRLKPLVLLPHVEAPPGALADQASELHVQRAESTELERRSVRFGARLGTRLQIVEGLAPGDRVALNVPAQYAEAGRIDLVQGPPMSSPSMSLPLVDMRAVSRVYNGQLRAVDGVNLEIRAREMLALTGPSGSGKSTLLTLLGLLDRPDEGAYVLSGHPTQGLTVDQRAQLRNRYLGLVFQAFHLLPDLSVRDNVALPLRYRRGVSRAEATERAQFQLSRVGLADLGSRLPQTLSGGQQQRVAIARALVGEPALLLADEPTGNLDQRTSQQIIELFQAIHERGVTVVVVTHSIEIAAQLPRRCQMLDGRLSQG